LWFLNGKVVFMRVKETKADQIKSYVYENILSGGYSERIPSLNQLADHFGTNIKTAKRAVDALEEDGVVVCKRGKGAFVNKSLIESLPILFVGRQNKEISGTFSSVLPSAVEMLSMNYTPYTYFLPRLFKGDFYSLQRLQGLQGILMEGELLDFVNLESLNVPLVLLHCAKKNNAFSVVRPNVEDGMRQVVDYLVSLGHRDIFYLAPEAGSSSSLDKLKRKSFSDSMKRHKLKTGPWKQTAYYRLEEGYEAAMSILDEKKRPTAIVCVNDEVALGVLNACAEKGVEVPGDINVVGFDDRAPAVMRTPFLTTVRVDFRQMAIEAVKLLNEEAARSGKDGIETEEIVLPVHLIIRETTGIINV
jgi:DNA-binding transcriptional regulator YhcF (GntR family)